MSRSMRLGYLVSEYPAVSHTFIQREVAELRALGFHIEVASINRSEQQFAMTEIERGEIAATFYVKRAGLAAIALAHLLTLARHPLSYIRGLLFALTVGGADLHASLFGLFYFGEAIVVGRWAEIKQLRHIHVHFANAAATVALVMSQVFPITYSFTMHGPDDFFDCSRNLLKEKVAAASFVCCIGHFARSQLMRIAPPSEWNKLEVAPLGVDPRVFSAPLQPHRSEIFEILCVGRLVPAKGQHLLLQAFERLLQRGHHARLRLVGDGPSRKSLVDASRKSGLEAQVIFTGAADGEQIRGFYGSADVFVLASFAEGIPVVLMEAMAMRVPCISTFVAGIPELIVNERDGLLVMPSDVQALADALERLLLDPALRRRLGVAGHQRVCEKYDLSRNVKRLASIFNERLADVGAAAAARERNQSPLPAATPSPISPRSAVNRAQLREIAQSST